MKHRVKLNCAGHWKFDSVQVWSFSKQYFVLFRWFLVHYFFNLLEKKTHVSRPFQTDFWNSVKNLQKKYLSYGSSWVAFHFSGCFYPVSTHSPFLICVFTEDQGKGIWIKLKSIAPFSYCLQNNRTALLIAAEKTHMPTLVQTMLDHGADPNHEDRVNIGAGMSFCVGIWVRVRVQIYETAKSKRWKPRCSE